MAPSRQTAQKAPEPVERSRRPRQPSAKQAQLGMNGV